MKLKTVRVTNFRSIEDTGEFSVGDITCLVGKNESGKSAVLQAIEMVNPAFGPTEYNKTLDYPRRHLMQYDQRHAGDGAKVTETTWELTTSERQDIENVVGMNALKGNVVKLIKHYGDTESRWAFQVDEVKAIKNIVDRMKFNASEGQIIGNCKTLGQIATILKGRQKPTEKQKKLYEYILKYKASITNVIREHVAIPKFLYFSHYDRMDGKFAIDALEDSSEEDSIFIDFLEFSGTSVEQLQSADEYEHLKAAMEGASNKITDEIFEYWSQNRKLAVEIDVHAGRPSDPPPYNSGTIIEARVKNLTHRISVPFSERSAGFIWFFSFLIKFSVVTNKHPNIILLLDEPGLTLHAKAQTDLLRYIDEKIKPKHQVIYSTHSPFIISPRNLDAVRTVEDIQENQRGTVVKSNARFVDKDTIFPLRASLGHEVAESFAIGEYTLVVGSPADIFYLQAVSTAFKMQDKEGLDSRWSLCPSGGMLKVATFVNLLTFNKMNIACIVDLSNSGKPMIEESKEAHILEQAEILTFTAFCGKGAADVEDMFSPGVFCNIVNKAYDLAKDDRLVAPKADKELEVRHVRFAQEHMESLSKDFDRFVAARWLLENVDALTEADTMTLTRFENLFKKTNSFLSTMQQES